MTCVVCGNWTNPVDLCHTCLEFFFWRYEDDTKILYDVLEWFRDNHGGEDNE